MYDSSGINKSRINILFVANQMLFYSHGTVAKLGSLISPRVFARWCTDIQTLNHRNLGIFPCFITFLIFFEFSLRKFFEIYLDFIIL